MQEDRRQGSGVQEMRKFNAALENHPFSGEPKASVPSKIETAILTSRIHSRKEQERIAP